MKNIFIMSLFSLATLAPVMAADSEQLPNAEGGDKNSPRQTVVEKDEGEKNKDADGLTQVPLSEGDKKGGDQEQQGNVTNSAGTHTDPVKSDKKNKCNIQ